MKKARFQEIYTSVFADPAPWRRWFFSEVVRRDSDIFLVDDSAGKPSAALLMQPYAFSYAGATLASGYISCVATRPEARTRGLASEAIRQALADARSRGYALCTLIPAGRALYFFYRRFGFAPVFYCDEERYTSLHAFGGGEGTEIMPSYQVFARLEQRQGTGLLHSEDDYRNILSDIAFESGSEVVFTAAPDGSCACLFAVFDAAAPGSAVTVRSLLADSGPAALAALAILRARVGERPVTVWRPPHSGRKAMLRPRGMMRIVDPLAVLGALAAHHPSLRCTVRLTDRLIPQNSGCYHLDGGTCTMTAGTDRRPDLDVDAEILATVLFSSAHIGDLLGIPASRPYMALMLDT